MWTEPIIDRTIEDIQNKTKKGYLNISDLNRIENNISFIGELMGVSVTTKTWQILDLPSSVEFNRIKQNIEKLENRIVFTSYEDFPDNPVNTYDKVNLIESLLKAIKEDWQMIEGTYLFCGDNEYCGSSVF